MTLTFALAGCGDDLPDGVLESTGHVNGSSGSGSSSEDGGVDETADSTETSGNPVADGAPCNLGEEIADEYNFEPPEAQAASLNGLNDCNFDEILGAEDTL